ncbi:hypothetical protein ABB37_06798 [Leptomonas pyrrhocoris]|uniref:Uncharacterized protein n=1 Tax=Leptomonas pyrrhocoris TaxID=157538 RepID=A0A0N0DTW5_LEPPY|nr:hypothetical protein ABB37_06798 [Leptomonas pyrrhocoris]XP_015656503.1 hypothetical protein ABB37_06798 [Leptomonas pyrrhocoris]KPA78063.1 hypothetical protein ABB37_06798 [Leptomonas pyrrhocoris]KPA78064.1 hypothetical protein ABB37_06798 [Leptomonas pyrrhocoris]|eukprot:XP_015656502.1 hypothetical protein ABB37_06798 [Leptomonas pyrrhocoris]
MGICCGSAKNEGGGTSPKTAGKSSAENQFHDVPARALRVEPVAFDMFVPGNASPADPDAKLGESRALNNMSCTLFDASMHSMRDMSMTADHTAPFDPLAQTMNNMSFTNSFKAVDRNVVRDFMNNVARLAEHGRGNQSLLEESMQSPITALENKSPVLGGSTPSTAITQEDLNYIAGGATLPDRVARLQEVETVLRQTIEGTWRVDSMLLQLAFCQVVPTLRQRRRPWGTAPPAGSSTKRGSVQSPAATKTTRAAKQPVLVIHAPGVQLDRSLSLETSAMTKSGLRPSDTTIVDNKASKANFSPPSGGERNSPESKEASLEMSFSRSRMEAPPGAKVEQYELLALTGRDVDAHNCPGAHVENEMWDFLATDRGAATLNEGKCIFRFMSSSLAKVDAETRATVEPIINLSSFKDEVTENNTPKVDVNDPDDASKYIAIVVKTMYLLPGITVQNISKDLMVSPEYQKACQPSENKVQDCDFADTFRLTITIVRFIFSLTIQFKVSEITDRAVLESLAVCDGMVPAKAIMLERTKRHVAKTDATAKVRSVLLYYPVNDGVLVDNLTIVLNTSLPKVVSKIMNSFGSQGAAQSVTTTKLTRDYMVKRFGDTRTK